MVTKHFMTLYTMSAINNGRSTIRFILVYSSCLSHIPRSYCEYVEEFPVQALPQFSSISGHEISSHGLIVLVLQYGTGKIDFLGRGRAQFDSTNAWKSHFLHPVFYYYDKLPTGEEKCGCD